ncbi:MAG: hypothetical protein ACXWBO_15635 [Ilumatobacteraceae bacterium]
MFIVLNGRRWGLAAVALMVLSACGSSHHRYLANRDEKVYLRVPSSWHDVRLSPTLQDPLLQATSDAKIISKEIVSPQQGAVEQTDLTGLTPFATMTVYQTSGAFNQQLSASVARAAAGLVSFDPVLPPTDKQDLAEVVDFNPSPSNAKAKVSGSNVVYRVRSDKNSDWGLTVNLSTFFDSSTQRLYALEVICTPSCYLKSAAEISGIGNSWRIG